MVTVVVGAGKTGLSCIRYFRRYHPSLALRVLDSREHCPGIADIKKQYPDIPVMCGPFEPRHFADAQRVVLSPGVQHWAEKIKTWVAPTVLVTGDLDLFAEAIAGHGIATIGVTGSNGKSTVTTLVGEILRAQGEDCLVGGNLGTPALDLLPAPGGPWPRIIVLELSSFQLAITQQLPLTVATILNLSPDHIDYHGSEAAYAEAKSRIFRTAGYAVVNRDAPNLTPYIPHDIPEIRFGLSSPEKASDFGLIMDATGDTWLCQGKKRLLNANILPLSGTHNVANVLAALALVARLSPTGQIENMAGAVHGVMAFKGLPHRCQWVRTINGVPWINDSKGTNVGATEQALYGLGKSIPGKWILIAGGDGKGADFSTLLPVLRQYVKAVILFGKDKTIMESVFKTLVPCYLCATLEEAVSCAHRLSKTGEGVLLSPACASLDMFINYEARGHLFVEYVEALPEK